MNYNVSNQSLQDNGKTSVALSFQKRIIRDVKFRRKIVLSVALYGLFLCLGWNVGQLGPSLMDLQQITRTSLDEISYVLVAFSVGFVVGVALAPLLMKKANPIMTLIIMNLIIAIATAVTPWCNWFGVMVVVLTLRGISHGVNDAGCNMLILKIWGTENGPYMQSLHFSFAIGAVISPLAMAPFLTLTSSIEKGNLTILSKSSKNKSYLISELSLNETISTSDCRETIVVESVIHGAFIISAGLALFSTISFLYFVCTQDKSSADNQPIAQRLKTNMTHTERTGTIVAMCTAFFLAMILEKTVIFFLPTFVVEHLKWQKVQGSYTISAFWGAFAIGRLLAIVISKRFKMRHILGSSLIVLVIASVGLLVTNLLKAGVGVWIFIPCLGFFQSTLFPSLMTWTEVEFFKVSGRLVSLFMVCGTVGSILIPIALGYLIELYSPMWFCYTLVTFSFVMFVVYLLLLYISRKIKPKETEISITTDA